MITINEILERLKQQTIDDLEIVSLLPTDISQAYDAIINFDPTTLTEYINHAQIILANIEKVKSLLSNDKVASGLLEFIKKHLKKEADVLLKNNNNSNTTHSKLNDLYKAIEDGDLTGVKDFLKDPLIQTSLQADENHDKKIQSLILAAINNNNIQSLECILHDDLKKGLALFKDELEYFAVFTNIILKEKFLNNRLKEIIQLIREMIGCYLTLAKKQGDEKLYDSLIVIFRSRKKEIYEALKFQESINWFIDYCPPGKNPISTKYENIKIILYTRKTSIMEKISAEAIQFFYNKNPNEAIILILRSTSKQCLEYLLESFPLCLKTYVNSLDNINDIKKYIQVMINASLPRAKLLECIVENLNYEKHDLNIVVLKEATYLQRLGTSFKSELLKAVKKKKSNLAPTLSDPTTVTTTTESQCQNHTIELPTSNLNEPSHVVVDTSSSEKPNEPYLEQADQWLSLENRERNPSLPQPSVTPVRIETEIEAEPEIEKEAEEEMTELLIEKTLAIETDTATNSNGTLNDLYTAIEAGDLTVVKDFLKNPLIQTFLQADKKHDEKIQSLLLAAINNNNIKSLECILHDDLQKGLALFKNELEYFAVLTNPILKEKFLKNRSKEIIQLISKMIDCYLTLAEKQGDEKLYDSLVIIFRSKQKEIYKALKFQESINWFIDYCPPGKNPILTKYKNIKIILHTRNVSIINKTSAEVIQFFYNQNPTEAILLILRSNSQQCFKYLLERFPLCLKTYVNSLDNRNDIKTYIRVIINANFSHAKLIELIVGNLNYEKHDLNIAILKKATYPQWLNTSFKSELLKAIEKEKINLTLPPPSGGNEEQPLPENENVLDPNELERLINSSQITDRDGTPSLGLEIPSEPSSEQVDQWLNFENNTNTSYYNTTYLTQFPTSPTSEDISEELTSEDLPEEPSNKRQKRDDEFTYLK